MKSMCLVVLLFIVLSFAFTFPLGLKFSSCIPAFHSTDEPFGILWGLWWDAYSFRHHLNANFSSYIIAPFGLDLSDNPAYPLVDAWNTFLSILCNEIIAYNLQIIASFILAGLFMYLLVYYLLGDRLAALFAGIAYSFCPYHAVRAWQHPSLAQIQWFPLYILALCKLRQEKGLRPIFLAALALSVIGFFNYYYLFFGVVLAGAIIIYDIFFDRRKGLIILGRMSVMLGIAFMLLLPFILPIALNVFFNGQSPALRLSGYVREFADLFNQSARPLSYFLPATSHPVFGTFSERFIGSFVYGMSFTEHTLYLGWIPLILAILAFKWRRMIKLKKEYDYLRLFFYLAIAAWLFSQPPWWSIGWFKLYMPSFFTYKILPMFRAYCRFGIIVMLGVAVMAGLGLHLILIRQGSRMKKILIACVLSGCVLFEFWSYPPFKLIEVSRVPQAYAWLKQQQGEFTIAEYPLETNGPNELYKFYQSRHRKRIINGTIPGTYPNQIAHSITKLSSPETAATLAWLGVKYVLLNKESYLKTELVDDIDELNNIPKNAGLKFVRSFPRQNCSYKNIACIQNTGIIHMYEVIAQPPNIKKDWQVK